MLPTNAAANRISPMGRESDADRAHLAVRPAVRAFLAIGLTHAGYAHAASDDSPQWIQWAVLGAIALLVIGVALRMILAARFPKGYGNWARSRRDEFADRNAKWDAEDDAKR